MPTYIDGFEIDAVLMESRASESEITEHPVEKGVSITDHARIRPKTLSMDCLVSDTPVGALAERRTIEVLVGDHIPSDLARTWLLELQAARKIVMVSTEWTRADGTTGYSAFDNLMIQSVGEEITPESGDSATFKVTFKQITFATNNRTTVKVSVPRAKKKPDLGNKPTDTVKPAEKNKTWLKYMKDAAGLRDVKGDDVAKVLTKHFTGFGG